MNKYIFRTLLLLPGLLFTHVLWGQSVIVKGHILSEDGLPVTNANITFSGNSDGVFSDSLGNFSIDIPNDKKITLKVTALGFENEFKSIKPGEVKEMPVQIVLTSLDIPYHNIGDVEITELHRGEAGNIEINPENIGLIADPSGGVEAMLKILVGPSNELSSQYSVRGGNFDENLVYINGFEVYRPFLVSSGQQEGLSIVNPDLVGRIDFSTGGFQSKFGDKMSSVLDITYKKPKRFAGSFMASLLGAQGHIESASRSGKLYYMIGVRQKTNQYILQAQPTQGQYNPSFLDAQMVVGYEFSPRWQIEAIGNYSRNRFNFIPESSSEYFGFFNQAYILQSAYKGAEEDQFDAAFGGLSLIYKPSDRTSLRFLASYYQTNERETYDLSQEYFLNAVETDLGKGVGDILYSLGTGIVMTHARNYLNANVMNFAHRGSHASARHFFQWGLEAQMVSVTDKLKEWEYRDSAGYSQPHNPSVAAMYRVYNANNNLDYRRITAYVQDNIVLNEEVYQTLNVGIRGNYSFLNEELIISPRVQYSLKPNWKRDIIFRVATGLYAQPPFYREMRNFNGPLNTALKAQKSYHFAAGFDYNFTAWGDRPFKLTGEVFYKKLWDLVPYEFENVRIRYYPELSAEGYAYGGEVRLFGDLVKDAESWVSLGYLNTRNRIVREDGSYSGYIPRPTDRRFTFGLYFSDYLPRNKNFKVFLNLNYASGLPFNIPGKIFEENSQVRIPSYRRVDIGFATLLLDGKRNNRPAYSLFSYFDDIWLSVEVFNLLGNLNTLSYQWIQPLDSESVFMVPNRLTNRLINLKLAMRF